MGTIKVTSEQLSSTASQLASGSGEVENQLSTMRSQVSSLVDADWAGAASDSFRDLWDQWQTGASQLREALDGIHKMLTQAAQAYQDTEDQLASQLRGG
ncbi:MAG: WXG100 family type VII secretion target [Acidimicrobiia bacterium]